MPYQTRPSEPAAGGAGRCGVPSYQGTIFLESSLHFFGGLHLWQDSGVPLRPMRLNWQRAAPGLPVHGRYEASGSPLEWPQSRAGSFDMPRWQPTGRWRPDVVHGAMVAFGRWMARLTMCNIAMLRAPGSPVGGLRGARQRGSLTLPQMDPCRHPGVDVSRGFEHAAVVEQFPGGGRYPDIPMLCMELHPRGDVHRFPARVADGLLPADGAGHSTSPSMRMGSCRGAKSAVTWRIATARPTTASA